MVRSRRPSYSNGHIHNRLLVHICRRQILYDGRWYEGGTGLFLKGKKYVLDQLTVSSYEYEKFTD